MVWVVSLFPFHGAQGVTSKVHERNPCARDLSFGTGRIELRFCAPLLFFFVVCVKRAINSRSIGASVLVYGPKKIKNAHWRVALRFKKGTLQAK